MECASRPLYVPVLDELSEVMSIALKTNFQDVVSNVVGCPDLLKEWGVPSIGGSGVLVEVGGTPNLFDPTYHHLSYAISDISKCIKGSYPFVIGAAAGDAIVLGHNAELMPAQSVDGSVCKTQTSFMTETGYKMEEYTCGRVGFLANLFMSKGTHDPVIHVRAKVRTGPKNFVSCIRQGLKDHYGDRCVGMGGIFKIVSGNFKAHIMPDFDPEMTEDTVDDWLKFFEFDCGAVFLSTMITGDPAELEDTDESLHLRVEHTHFINMSNGQGGHYHYDTTPDEVEYIGYFAPAHTIYRIEDAFKRSY